ncbi:hypothetical protein BJ741DRAFT_593914 [Chytriomyces cf. hyalinus JEL632]|nr:hypothetical protein BJ741DRAFT_593914 [Chytriomyces cf. hyalinus JEL632]
MILASSLLVASAFLPAATTAATTAQLGQTCNNSSTACVTGLSCDGVYKICSGTSASSNSFNLMYQNGALLYENTTVISKKFISDISKSLSMPPTKSASAIQLLANLAPTERYLQQSRAVAVQLNLSSVTVVAVARAAKYKLQKWPRAFTTLNAVSQYGMYVGADVETGGEAANGLEMSGKLVQGINTGLGVTGSEYLPRILACLEPWGFNRNAALEDTQQQVVKVIATIQQLPQLHAESAESQVTVIATASDIPPVIVVNIAAAMYDSLVDGNSSNATAVAQFGALAVVNFTTDLLTVDASTGEIEVTGEKSAAAARVFSILACLVAFYVL